MARDRPATTRWRANSPRTSRNGSHHSAIAAMAAIANNDSATMRSRIAGAYLASGGGDAAASAGATGFALAMVSCTEPVVIGW